MYAQRVCLLRHYIKKSSKKYSNRKMRCVVVTSRPFVATFGKNSNKLRESFPKTFWAFKINTVNVNKTVLPHRAQCTFDA